MVTTEKIHIEDLQKKIGEKSQSMQRHTKKSMKHRAARKGKDKISRRYIGHN